MKRIIVSKTNDTWRGNSMPQSERRKALRRVVNEIYDEVEHRGYVALWGDIQSRGNNGYNITWFINDDQETYNKAEAEELAGHVEDLVEELGYANQVDIKLIERPQIKGLHVRDGVPYTPYWVQAHVKFPD